MHVTLGISDPITSILLSDKPTVSHKDLFSR